MLLANKWFLHFRQVLTRTHVNVSATVSSITLSSVVSSGVAHVSLTVTAPDGTKTITQESSLTTPVAVDYGVNSLTVTVSGAEGTTVYSISITRAEASSVTALEIDNYKWGQDRRLRTVVHQKVPRLLIRLRSRVLPYEYAVDVLQYVYETLITITIFVFCPVC